MNHWTNVSQAGMLPAIICDADPRPVSEQIHDRYAHGGGFMPFEGFTLHNTVNMGKSYLQYPGDPPMKEVSRTDVRSELVILFEASWVAIVQPDLSYAVTRMD